VTLGKGLKLKNVLYVPKLNCNLVSISKLCKQLNCSVTYFDDFCVIQDRTLRTLIGAGKQREGVYYYKRSASNQANAVNTRSLWHNRLGHPSNDVLFLLPSHLGVVGSLHKDKEELCEICLRAKQTRNKFPLSNSNAKGVFDLIHCDICGPYKVSSSFGAHYFLSIVDDASRPTWVYLMKDRTEASRFLKGFIIMVRNQFDKAVKVVKSDNGSEFTSGPMQEFYNNYGILRESSCVDTPQQNGRVERKHRHILNVARALRFQAHLPIQFWGECVLTAAYLINRTPSKLLKGKTPYEVLFNCKPSYEEMRVFGTLCFARNNPRTKDKFAPRSRKCVFLGYSFGKKGWKVCDLETREIFVSRDVVFQENIFPFATSEALSNENFSPRLTVPGVQDDDFFALGQTKLAMDQETSTSPTTSLPTETVRRREGLDLAQSSPRGPATNQD